MKVSYLKFNPDIGVLSNLVMNLINTRHIVCIRDFPSDRDLVASFWHKLGQPIKVNDTSFHENIEVMKNVNDDKWYNQSTPLPLHIDGLLSHVDGTHQWLPMTALYANKLDQVQGGNTFFFDVANMATLAYARVFPLRIDAYKDLKAAFQHPTMEGARLIREAPFVRRDRYGLRWFPLIDDWFFRWIEQDKENHFTKTFHRFVEYMAKEDHERYDHVWKERDMLIWTNEGFLHGRTTITHGTREMWRGIIRDTEQPRSRFYPRDTEKEVRNQPDPQG